MKEGCTNLARKRRISPEINEVNEILSLENMLESVLKSKIIEGVSTQTLRNYKKTFAQFKGYLEDIEVDNVLNLTQSNAKDFVYFMIQKDLKPATINTYIRYIKSAYNLLSDEGTVENIFKGIKQVKVDEKSIDVLSVEEIKELLKAMDLGSYTEFRDYVFIHVLIDTFSRIGETLALTKKDVDLVNHTVTFNKTKSRKLRTVPISKTTVKLLKKLIKETEEFESEYIFLSWNGKPMENSGRQLSTKLKEYAKRAGIKKRVHPHLFRHSASAHFLKETGNIRVLQKILGHSDISITQRYSHILDSTVHDLHDKYSIINAFENTKKRKTKL